MTGIIKPTVFYKGRLVATWKRDKKDIILDVFEDLTSSDLKELEGYRQAYQEKLP